MIVFIEKCPEISNHICSFNTQVVRQKVMYEGQEIAHLFLFWYLRASSIWDNFFVVLN